MGKGRKYPKGNKSRYKVNKTLGEVATENSEPSLENPEDSSFYSYSKLGGKSVPVEKSNFNKFLDAFKYIGAAIAILAPICGFVFWIATLQSQVGVNEKGISKLSKDGDERKKDINDIKMQNVSLQKDIGYIQKQLDSSGSGEKVNK